MSPPSQSREGGLSGPDENNSASRDPWEEAFRRLSPEDQKQFGDSRLDMLGTLQSVSPSNPEIRE